MTADLLQSELPVLGTAAHALTSPLPYGVGVHSVGSDGSTQELPMYYVSPKLSSLRQLGEMTVKPGWYVVAVPGTVFNCT